MAEECGCKPDYTFVGHGEDATEVIYCPLHKAAPEMLAALEDTTNGLRALATAVGGDIPDDVLHRIQHGVEALAAARGQEVGA